MADDTITREELAKVLASELIMIDDATVTGATVTGATLTAANPDRMARAIFEKAARLREPEYERGRFYRDANGTVFYCMLGEGERPSFSTMPEGKPYPHDYPVRPLRRLVPEPSWLPETVIRAVADVLTEYTERKQAEEATARICKLIREGTGRG